ncbi:LMBR1 domain-containing protein 2, partial [Clydaea vesicula]
PFGYVEKEFFWIFWKTLYWTMFCLTWFTVPVLQSFIRSGEFTFMKRLWAAIKENIIYYGVVGLLGAILLIYIYFSAKFDSNEDFMNLLMAAANGWGLILVTVMLGYGLVEFPRSFWYGANHLQRLHHLEFNAAKYRDDAVDSESELYDAAKELAYADKNIDQQSPLRVNIDYLLFKFPEAKNLRSISDSDERHPDVIDLKYLVKLNAKLKYCLKINDRNQAMYNFLLQESYFLMDVETNSKNPEKKFYSNFFYIKDDKYRDLKLKIYWLYFIHLKPKCSKILSVFMMIASLVLVWSESVFQIEGVKLSIPDILLTNPEIGGFQLEVASICFILYMCMCAYSALFKVRILSYYMMVKDHHSDNGSILFIGSYLCRLTFPLCYNFLNMLNDDQDNSIFAEYIGKSVNMAPLLGTEYNNWMPYLILILSIVTFFNLHGRLLRIFRIKGLFYQPKATDPECVEGREIIAKARSIEERKIIISRGGVENGGDFNSYNNYSTPAANNARDYLLKYKNTRISDDMQTESLLKGRRSDDSHSSAVSLKSVKGFNQYQKSGKGVFSSGGVGNFEKLEENVGGAASSYNPSGRVFGKNNNSNNNNVNSGIKSASSSAPNTTGGFLNRLWGGYDDNTSSNSENFTSQNNNNNNNHNNNTFNSNTNFSRPKQNIFDNA